MIVECDGNVEGEAVVAYSKSKPSRAIRSISGDVGRICPYAPRASARDVSRVIRTTFSRCVRLGGEDGVADPLPFAALSAVSSPHPVIRNSAAMKTSNSLQSRRAGT